MYIQGKFLNHKDDLTEVYEIRRKVFVEEQGIPEDLEFDELDKQALFCVVYEQEKKTQTVATGRMINLSESEYKIGHIAVLNEYRGQDYGDMIVRMLINKAFMSGALNVYVDSQEHAVNFYKKIGFTENNHTFEEAGITRHEMVISPNSVCKKCKGNHK